MYFFTRVFSFSKSEVTNSENKEVSIVICAKNEAFNLEKFLPVILSQEYHNANGKVAYEVLVVNDASTDTTVQVLETLQKQFSHLRYISISPNETRTFKGKKFALSKAVAHVNYEWLLMTDADCQPASTQWLSLMVAPLAQGKEIVCGYGAYRQQKGFLNAFIRWETLHTFLQYSTYISAGLPYMAVGRNLACTKEILLKAQQSIIWNKLPSGDDDLLIQTCSTKENTTAVTNKNAFTLSEAKATWEEWLHQKQRHLSTGKYYKPIIKLLLGSYAISHAFTWLLFFVLLFFSDWTLIFIIAMMRNVLYWIIWQSAALRMKERNLLKWMPLCDVSWAVYNFVLSPFIFFKNKQQWK